MCPNIIRTLESDVYWDILYFLKYKTFYLRVKAERPLVYDYNTDYNIVCRYS